jgi:KRAB domain-containing zinc finger protein
MASQDFLIENSLQRSLKTFIDHGYCSVCKVCFQSQELLKSHQDEFLLKNVCCQCTKKLDNASKLKNHWRKHNKEKPFQCKWCDKYYSQKNSLVRHQNLYCELAKGKHGQPEFSNTTLHTGLKSRLMPEVPNHSYPKVSDQKTKSNTSHLSELSNQSKSSKPKSSDLTNQMETNTTCRICSRKFYDIKSLENHRLHHQSQKSCCSCNKVMASKSKLMIHSRSHTKEFPFTCNICNRSFAERSTLRKHISTHGEKSFQCDSCGKAFARKDYLTKHSQVHRQLYKCSQCTFQCNNAGEIELHLNIHLRVQSALVES